MKILKVDHEKNESATVILKGLELEKIVKALEDTLKYHTCDNSFKNLLKEMKIVRDIVRFGEINSLEKREQSWEYLNKNVYQSITNGNDCCYEAR